MEARDLRIGNWYQEFSLRSEKYEYKQFTHADFYYTYDNECALIDFEPIPLTEEWLVKLGFEKQVTKHENIYRLGIFEYATSCGTIDLELENTENHITYTTNVKYVHQLQNLFYALTGEDLQIPQITGSK